MPFITDCQFSSHTSKHTHRGSHTNTVKAAVCQEKSGAPHCNHRSTLGLRLTTAMTKKLCFSVQKVFGNYFDWTIWVVSFSFFCPFLSFAHNVQLQLVLLLVDRHFNESVSDFFCSFLPKSVPQNHSLLCAFIVVFGTYNHTYQYKHKHI